MNKVLRACWATNNCYETTLCELSVNGSETQRLNFLGNTQGLPKLMGGKSLENVCFRCYGFLFLLHYVYFIFLHKTLSGVTSSLVVMMLSGQVVINPGALRVAQYGISHVPSLTELAFLSTICLSIQERCKSANTESVQSFWAL